MKATNIFYIVIGVAALFIIYCKCNNKDPKQVLQNLIKGKAATTTTGGTTGSSSNEQTDSTGNESTGGESSDTGNTDNTGADGSDYNDDYSSDDYSILPIYSISETNTLTTSTEHIYNFTYTKLHRNGKTIRWFHFNLSQTRRAEIAVIINGLADELANINTCFTNLTCSDLEKLTRNELSFAWEYFHQKGFVLTDETGGKYQIESISDIAVDPLQNNRENAYRLLTIINKYGADLDAEIGYEPED